MNKNLSNNDVWDILITAWWGKALLGVMCLGFAYFLYVDFTSLETGQVDHIWGPKLIITVYEMCGKWPPVGFLALFGAALVGWSGYQVITGKEWVSD